jgi:alpha-L-rhamnosidase
MGEKALNERLQVQRLRTEYLDNPLGIDATEPRFGWVVVSSRRGAAQSAYRVLAASSPELLAGNSGDLWDSGKVSSSESQHIVYAGQALTSEAWVFWKVNVWDENGRESGWSESASFTIGLLERRSWQGLWIGWSNDDKPTREQPKPNIYLRREFAVKAGVKRATVYATALGLYQLYLNGQRVGNDVFSPEWTDYHVRVQYQTYDVTALLREGVNAAGTILSHGWYCGYIGMFGYQKYGMNPAFLMQLNLEYEDGTKESLVTDGQWQASFGAIVRSDLQMGETVDARKEMPGWNEPAFTATSWVPADILYDYRGWLVAQMSRTIRVTEELPPVEIRMRPDGVTLIDFGQNFAGWMRIALTGEPGAEITFRYAEVLDERGNLYTDNLRLARQCDTYICKGGGMETFEPSFTYHGFRYVEISGGMVSFGDVAGIVVHSDLPETGKLETSSALVNRLIQNVRWTQRANFMSVPTDCPQRDERHGWTGDAQIFSGTAAYNMDVSAFFAKWLVDLEDAQRPTGAFTDFAPFVFGPKTEYGNDFTYSHTGSAGWADAPIIVAWKMYETYGDKHILRKHYEAFKRWVEFNRKQQPDGIRQDIPQYGDWLSVNERPFEEVVAEFGRMVSHYSTTPYDVYSTAYMANNAKILSDIAEVLGEEEDRDAYRELFRHIRSAYAARFVTEEGCIKGDTQTSYAMALEMDLLPEALRPAVVKRLVGKIREAGDMATTGFHGTMFLMKVLTDEGYSELAYKLMLREAYPSWLYSVNQGATTIWERWDGWTKEKGFQRAGMNSFCHYAFGSIGEWLYRNVGGIDRDPSEAGYRKLRIRPRVDGGISSARCSYDSMYGEVVTAWALLGGRFTLELTVPANVSAVVYIPASEPSEVREGDAVLAEASGVEAIGREGDCVICLVRSGTYRFSSQVIQ